MNIVIHPHARERMQERGILEDEVIATVEHGEQFPAKYKRFGFRRNFSMTLNGVASVIEPSK